MQITENSLVQVLRYLYNYWEVERGSSDGSFLHSPETLRAIPRTAEFINDLEGGGG